jgi:hypothetical protein
MNLKSIHHRLITGSLLATVALAGIAPAALAGHGDGQTQKYRRWDAPRAYSRGDAYGGGNWRGGRSRTVFVRHSSGGSTLGGFIGGLAVGAILGTAASHSNSHPDGRYESRGVYAPQRPDYRGQRGGDCESNDRSYGAGGGGGGGDYSYEDPYCHERFSSLSQYDAHCDRESGHPRYAEVFDNRSGACVGSMREDGDRWSKCGRDEWRDGGGAWNDRNDRNDRGGDYDDDDDDR